MSNPNIQRRNFLGAILGLPFIPKFIKEKPKVEYVHHKYRYDPNALGIQQEYDYVPDLSEAIDWKIKYAQNSFPKWETIERHLNSHKYND